MPQFPPVVAVVSSDPFLQGQATQTFLKSLGEEPQRRDFDGTSAKLAEVLDEVRSVSMFGGLRVAIVRNASDFISDHREALEDYCASPGDGGILLLRCDSLPKTQRIYKAIEKIGHIIDAQPPKLFELPNWVIDRARAVHNTPILPDAAKLLCDLIGADLGRLDTELGKLSLQTDSGKIELKHVSGAVVFQRDQQMWEMTDQLTLGKVDEAVRRWRFMIQSDPTTEYRAVTWLAIWVEKAQRAMEMSQQRVPTQTIGTQLKIWPAANVDKLLATVKRLGEARLNQAVTDLVELDRSIKSTGTNVAMSVERFLVGLRA
jgi:DNA polymerase III subunit delta